MRSQPLFIIPLSKASYEPLRRIPGSFITSYKFNGIKHIFIVISFLLLVGYYDISRLCKCQLNMKLRQCRNNRQLKFLSPNLLKPTYQGFVRYNSILYVKKCKKIYNKERQQTRKGNKHEQCFFHLSLSLQISRRYSGPPNTKDNRTHRSCCNHCQSS